MENNSVLIQDLKDCIIKCSEHISSNHLFGDKRWTDSIKDFIGRLGEDKGFKICASTDDKLYDSEWLYDLVWYKENEEGFIIEVPLVVESEWKKDLIKDIKFDFEKLLLAKSQLKLMICNCEEDDQESYISYFQKAINICPMVIEGEEFLIAILNLVSGDADEFSFHLLTKTVVPK